MLILKYQGGGGGGGGVLLPGLFNNELYFKGLRRVSDSLVKSTWRVVGGQKESVLFIPAQIHIDMTLLLWKTVYWQ